MTNNSLYKKIEGYQNISFDMFDTIIERKVMLPTDIFAMVGDSVLESGEEFRIKRIIAEQRARQKNNNHEVTLDQIYAELRPIYQNSTELLKKTEVSLELDNCIPRKEIDEVYYRLLNNGNNIFIVTDMYLPRDIISKMLDKCCIKGYNDLLISNEEECGKSSGELFKIVLERHKILPGEIIHVGDDWKADYLGPRKVNINSIIIPRKRRVRRRIKSEFVKLRLLGKDS